MKRNRQLLPKSYVSIVVNDKSWLVNRWQCHEIKTELSDETWSGHGKWINEFKRSLQTGNLHGSHYDLRDIADWWFQETKVIHQKINSQKKRKKSRKNLVSDKDLKKALRENSIPFEDFVEKISRIPKSEPLDARMVSGIFAWPQGTKAPQRVQQFRQ